MANVQKSIGQAMTVVILILVSALIVGTLLSQTVFSELEIINTTALGNDFGLFVTGIVGFLAIIGTALGITWLVKTLKPVFSKKEGVGALSA